MVQNGPYEKCSLVTHSTLKQCKKALSNCLHVAKLKRVLFSIVALLALGCVAMASSSRRLKISFGTIEGDITLPVEINFNRFVDYEWSGVRSSPFGSILTVKEFQDKYTYSSVHKYDFDAGWYQHTNICVDGDNNVKYVNRSADSYNNHARELGLSHAQGPLLPAVQSWEVLPPDIPIQMLHGSIILLHCWRSPGDNPIHFIYGYGALFRAFLSAPLSGSPFNHVVFHQCPHPHLNHFFRAFWEVLLIEGYERRAVDDQTEFHVVSDLSRVVCMENVTGNEWGLPPYFAASAYEWDAWKRQLSKYLDNALPGLREMAIANRKDPTRPIRIAIFQRQSAANGLRKYTNLPDVLNLVENYTSDYEVITATPETNLTSILQLFNSFDILITPHGSHIANVLFTLRDDVAIIETVGVCMNMGPSNWFGHRLSYFISSGHGSDQESVQDIIHACRHERDAWCIDRVPPPNCDDGKAEEVMRSDLIIDLQILGQDIERASQVLSYRS